MKQKKIEILPSILSGDFGKLGEEAKRLERAGADGIHIDIMDGHFVPNLTFGPGVVGAINRATDLFLDVHLMIYNPYDYIEAFVKEGADRITFHFEATEDVEDTIEFIQKCGKKVGLAFCPETSFEMIPKYIPLVDLVLLMTVNPGFGGQAFIPEVVEKVQLTREFADRLKKPLNIEVDGGINLVTAKQCVEAGANVLVSGNFLFKEKNMEAAIAAMRGLS